MTAGTASPASTGVQRGESRVRVEAVSSLRLVPCDGGWSLVGPDGGLMFHAPGIRGRRRCLQFARAHGVLTLFS